jgi:hypothetical protein
MCWNIIFVAIWVITDRNKNLKRGWRIFWRVLGIINLALLVWAFIVFVAMANAT